MAASPNIQSEHKRVDIDDNGNAHNVDLSRSAGDQLVWVSQGPKFTITFQGNAIPFAQRVYHVPAGGTCDPGPIVGEAGTYPYIISKDGMQADPQVIIRD